MDSIIAGKSAYDYEEKVKRSKQTQIFDSIISNAISGERLIICDLCCGPGNSIHLLLKKSTKVIGVDASQEMIDICEGKFEDKRVEFHVKSADKTELPKSHFDYLIIRMGLHHIKDKIAVLNESYRILKTGGKIVIIDKFVDTNVNVDNDTNCCGDFIITKDEYHELFTKSAFTTPTSLCNIQNPNVEGNVFFAILSK